MVFRKTKKKKAIYEIKNIIENLIIWWLIINKLFCIWWPSLYYLVKIENHKQQHVLWIAISKETRKESCTDDPPFVLPDPFSALPVGLLLRQADFHGLSHPLTSLTSLAFIQWEGLGRFQRAAGWGKGKPRSEPPREWILVMSRFFYTSQLS